MKREVLERLGYEIRRRLLDNDAWCVDQPALREFSWGRFETEDEAFDAAWRDAIEDGTIYLHKKGGVYRTLMEGRSTDTGAAVIVYEHLWPHERGVWVRDLAEFHEPSRFTRIEA